uniref:Uncharacterized protein n=1 Tax=Cucumis melo TaxID=3656 RepID=A0A9I9E6Z2_CUCME
MHIEHPGRVEPRSPHGRMGVERVADGSGMRDPKNVDKIYFTFIIIFYQMPRYNGIAAPENDQYVDLMVECIFVGANLRSLGITKFSIYFVGHPNAKSTILLQVESTECGYYVMKFMREIVNRESFVISDSIDPRKPYSQADLFCQNVGLRTKEEASEPQKNALELFPSLGQYISPTNQQTSSKNMANAHKEEFVSKLHLDEITFIIYIPKGEQVWILKGDHVWRFKTLRGSRLNHNFCRQLLGRVSSKDITNTCKREFGDKLHLGYKALIRRKEVLHEKVVQMLSKFSEIEVKRIMVLMRCKLVKEGMEIYFVVLHGVLAMASHHTFECTT